MDSMSYGKCQIIQELCKIHARYLIQESCIINHDPVRTLAILMSGNHGLILHGSITNKLSEPYGNLGKILVELLWPNLAW